MQPGDHEALGVFWALFSDQEKKYPEADEVYRRALANSPPEPALLNNFGNHLIATGKPAEARKTFLRVIGLDAENTNARCNWHGLRCKTKLLMKRWDISIGFRLRHAIVLTV